MKLSIAILFLAVSPILATQSEVTRKLSATPNVYETIEYLSSTEVTKTVTTTLIPSSVEICLLQDETGSFGDDQHHLKDIAVYTDIYNTIKALSPGAQFAVAGFKDYKDNYIYHRNSIMSPDFSDWEQGILDLNAYGGYDFPEAQYDAIVEAVSGPQNCGWSSPDSDATKILIVTTDATFHTPGSSSDPHIHDSASTTAELINNGIIVIGLKASSAGPELDALAAATGGSSQPLASDGSNIAKSILAGIKDIKTTVQGYPVGCDGLDVTFSPHAVTITSGENAVFSETITVSDASLCGETRWCEVKFTDDRGAHLGTQEIDIKVPGGCCASHAQCGHLGDGICIDNQCTEKPECLYGDYNTETHQCECYGSEGAQGYCRDESGSCTILRSLDTNVNRYYCGDKPPSAEACYNDTECAFLGHGCIHGICVGGFCEATPFCVQGTWNSITMECDCTGGPVPSAGPGFCRDASGACTLYREYKAGVGFYCKGTD